MLTPLQNDQEIHLKKLKEVTFDTQISTVTPTPTGKWIINFRDIPQVILLDKNFNIIWKRDYQAKSQKYSYTQIAYNSMKGQVSLSGRDFVTIRNSSGQEVFSMTHTPWDSFSGSENHFTSDGDKFINIIPTKNKRYDLLQIRNTQDFSIIEELKVLNQDSNYSFQPIHKSNRLLVQLSRGQDDGFVYELVIQPEGSRFEELPMCLDRIAWNLSNDQSEFITAPHYGGSIISYSIDTKDELRKIDEDKVFRNIDNPEISHTDEFGFIAKFLSFEKKIITITQAGRLLLLDILNKKLIGEIIPEGYKIEGFDPRGEVTIIPSKIDSYEGDINNFGETQEENLMIEHGGEMLALYDLSNLKEILNRPKTLSLF